MRKLKLETTLLRGLARGIEKTIYSGKVVSIYLVQNSWNKFFILQNSKKSQLNGIVRAD